MLRNLLFIAILSLPFGAPAQETLRGVLDRGYVAEWLVCGPFMSDIEGGVEEAARRAKPPLGETDMFEGLGGVAKLRPTAGMKVPSRGGELAWEARRTAYETLDLQDLFQSRREGVVFAAFYIDCPAARTIYMDIQTPLGVRILHDGLVVRKAQGKDIASIGLDRFMLRLHGGVNRFIFQIPMLSADAIEELLDADRGSLAKRGFPNRPILNGHSAYEFAMRILPIEPLTVSDNIKSGDIAYVPRLTASGYSSAGDGKYRQDALLTFFNPLNEPSPPITVTVAVEGVGEAPEQVVMPIPPHRQYEALLSIPAGDAAPGAPLSLDVTLTTPVNERSFKTTITTGERPDKGRITVVTGPFWKPDPPEEQATATRRQADELENQMAFSQIEEAYGFSLGWTPAWKAWLTLRPERREDVIRAIELGACAPDALMTPLDERIVSGETLVRDIIHGQLTARTLLRDAGTCAYAWDVPAICPQTPQLLGKGGIEGIATNIVAPGIRPFAWQLALDGSRIPIRRKQPGPWPATRDSLASMVETQRQEIMSLGFGSDVFINPGLKPPPEAYLSGALASLRKSIPEITLSGAGGGAFMRNALETMKTEAIPMPTSARLLNRRSLGMLAAQPELKEAYGLASGLLLRAEKLATLAAMEGASYPERTLDLAWRQLLYVGHPERVGFCREVMHYADALSACREAMGIATDIAASATRHIAGLVDSRSNAPASPANSEAIVVFNPSAWLRTGICDANVIAGPNGGVTFRDNLGAAVPYEVTSLKATNARVAIRFIARDVPALGYRIFYSSADAARPDAVGIAGTAIENSELRLALDPAHGGRIVSLIQKATGFEYVSSGMNDVVLISEDPARTQGGRELWTNALPLSSSMQPAEIALTQSPLRQKAIITMPFGGGQIIREVTVYEGIPWIECRLAFQNVKIKDSLAGVSVSCLGVGNVPVFGERFGVSVGRRDAGISDFRFAGVENASFTGAQPALDWMAFTPNDQIDFGRDTSIPLGPAAVIYGLDDAYVRPARELVEAFVSRGIPADAYRDEKPAKNAAWTDSLAFDDSIADLKHGLSMRIVIGRGENSALFRRLTASLPDDVAMDFNKRTAEGAILLVMEPATGDGLPPTPVLLLGADTPDKMTALVRQVADGVAAHGVITAPQHAYQAGPSIPRGDRGVALLHHGAKAHAVSRDNDITMYLAQDSVWESDKANLTPTGSLNAEFHYAIYPFQGDWRDAACPQKAQEFAEPLQAAAMPIQLGGLPATRSLLSVSDPGFIITALKPQGYPSAQLETQAPGASTLILRGHETFGDLWNGTITCGGPINGAARAGLTEEGSEDLDVVGQDIEIQVKPFSIETIRLLPANVKTLDPKAVLDPPVTSSGPVMAEYWTANRGAAPAGNQPVTITLRGQNTGGAAAVDVVVANHSTTLPLRSAVLMTAPEGVTISPDQFSFFLKPGDHLVRRLAILGAPAGALPALAGQIRANNEIQRDVIEPSSAPFTIRASSDGPAITVDVTSASGLPLQGYVELITPPSSWPGGAAPGAPILASNRQAVDIPPKSTQSYTFVMDGDTAPGWIVAKAAANDNVAYQRITLAPPIPMPEPETDTLTPDEPGIETDMAELESLLPEMDPDMNAPPTP